MAVSDKGISTPLVRSLRSTQIETPPRLLTVSSFRALRFFPTCVCRPPSFHPFCLSAADTPASTTMQLVSIVIIVVLKLQTAKFNVIVYPNVRRSAGTLMYPSSLLFFLLSSIRSRVTSHILLKSIHILFLRS